MPYRVAKDRARIMSRVTPDHTRVDGTAVGRHKDMARAAWRSARECQPIPLAIVDRLWADTLSATALAEPAIAARMFRRSETLLRLLLDWQKWPRLVSR
jgi:hypothetical protein